MKTNSKIVKTAILGLLSIQNLLATSAQAQHVGQLDSEEAYKLLMEQSPQAMAESIIQKRIVGFDPKQAVETLTFLQLAGVQQFETDGSVLVGADMIQDIMQTAQVDGMEVRILETNGEAVRVKFAAHQVGKFDINKLDRAQQLASFFRMKCDMDDPAKIINAAKGLNPTQVKLPAQLLNPEVKIPTQLLKQDKFKLK